MKKENKLWIILNSIFLIAFNVFFFTLRGAENKASVWISYSFIHFAYFMLLLTPILTRKGKSSAVFGFSIYYISSIYFLTAFVTGIVFILISPDKHTYALLSQLTIAFFYSIILVSLLIANERTADAEEMRKTQINYIKVSSEKIKGLIERTKDKEPQKSIEKVYDLLYSSPIKTHPDLTEVEESILASIRELERNVVSDNKEEIIAGSNSLITKINERNRMLKSLQ
ncbi:MAG: hypothetical protein FWG98_03255 [Candidatus Cloacimonetes bacterium]|nr:hypothetical protein [Candidatus Cloacimonadota bacterium]